MRTMSRNTAPNANVSGCGCGGGCGEGCRGSKACGCGGKGSSIGRGCGCGGCSYTEGRKGCCNGNCGPSHFTTLSNEVVGLSCGGCNIAHEGRHCPGCDCCGCQDLAALARAPAIVSGVGFRARAKRPIVYPVRGCSHKTHTPRAAVSGCACSRVSAEVATASGLGTYKAKNGMWMRRFIGPDNYFYEGQVAGGTQENPSLINIRRIS